MNEELWTQHLQDRVYELERRLKAAQTAAAQQRSRAELWKHRALRKTRFHTNTTATRRAAVMTDQWIVIPDWDRFQHYKNRNPPWIKSYTNLLSNPEYLALNPHQRGVLHGIWLLYAASAGEVAASPARLSHLLGFPSEHESRASSARARGWVEAGERLGRDGVGPTQDSEQQPVRMRDLKRLEQAGFIRTSASKPLADSPVRASTDAMPEKEVEKEGLNKLSTSQGPPRARSRTEPTTKSVVGRITRAIQNGAITDPITLQAETRAHPELTPDDLTHLASLLPGASQPQLALPTANGAVGNGSSVEAILIQQAEHYAVTDAWLEDSPASAILLRYPTLQNHLEHLTGLAEARRVRELPVDPPGGMDSPA